MACCSYRGRRVDHRSGISSPGDTSGENAAPNKKISVRCNYPSFFTVLIGHSTTSAMIRARPHIRQAVTLTGLGSDRFSEAVKAIERVVIQFMNKLPPDSLESWQPSKSQNADAFDAGSRYFINARVAGAAERGPFDALADPNGVLAAMVDEDFIHIIDNDVQYYARTANPGATLV